MTDRAVCTIGYEGKSLDDLIELLHGEDVEMLVDVRLNAMSRKAGFSKRRLDEGLSAAGIEYRHEPRLGNPKDNRPGFAKGDEAAYDAYRRRLANEAKDAFDAVLALSHERAIALLCFEADHRHCHRTCITERMQELDRGLRVVNL